MIESSYRLLFSRTKKAYSSLDLDPTKAPPIPLSYVEKLDTKKKAMVMGLIQCGKRMDSHHGGKAKRFSYTSTSDKKLQVHFLKDKCDRLGAVTIDCVCSSDDFDDLCFVCCPALADVFSRCFPILPDDETLLSVYDDGFSQHSFRRTFCLGLLQQQGREWCENNIESINSRCGWKTGKSKSSSQFWNYTKDFQRWAIRFPPVSVNFANIPNSKKPQENSKKFLPSRRNFFLSNIKKNCRLQCRNGGRTSEARTSEADRSYLRHCSHEYKLFSLLTTTIIFYTTITSTIIISFLVISTIIF